MMKEAAHTAGKQTRFSFVFSNSIPGGKFILQHWEPVCLKSITGLVSCGDPPAIGPQSISGSTLSGKKRSAPSEADKIGRTLSSPRNCCFPLRRKFWLLNVNDLLMSELFGHRNRYYNVLLLICVVLTSPDVLYYDMAKWRQLQYKRVAAHTQLH